MFKTRHRAGFWLKQENSSNSRKYTRVTNIINIIGGSGMAKGEKCPSCKEDTFHDESSAAVAVSLRQV